MQFILIGSLPTIAIVGLLLSIEPETWPKIIIGGAYALFACVIVFSLMSAGSPPIAPQPVPQQPIGEDSPFAFIAAFLGYMLLFAGLSVGLDKLLKSGIKA